MPPTRWHPDRKVKLPQPSPTIIQDTDTMPSSGHASHTPANAAKTKRPVTDDFIQNTIGPLLRLKDPVVPSSLLRDLDITVVPLDFRTGRSTNPSLPTLVHLHPLEALHAEIERIKPWETFYLPNKDSGYYEYRPRDTDQELDYCCEAKQLSHIVSRHLAENQSNKSQETVLDQGSWICCLSEQAVDYLGTQTDPKYKWWLHDLYYNYDGRPPQTYDQVHAKDKPHGICQIIDSTPFHPQRIRTSELNTIVLLAASRHCQPQYKHLDYFGITVMSFWDREVRLVQGLVNFRTHAIELRLSPSQSFDAGIRSSDEQYTKFLTLLAYFGDVQDLSGL